MIARTLAILLLGASLHAAERPNVLFIAVDDLRASVGVFGDKLAVTPHIDALGARGTVLPMRIAKSPFVTPPVPR